MEIPGAQTLTAAHLHTPAGVLSPGWVRVDGGRIVALGAGQPEQAPAQHFPGHLLPGFVDMHAHGGGGHRYDSTDAAEILRAREFHRANGTTTAIASLVTAPIPTLLAQVAVLRDLVLDGHFAGIHLEGPWLSTVHCGAHAPRLLIPPTRADLDLLFTAARGTISMVTLAPELPGGLDAIRYITDHGAIAAIGHTNATLAESREAIAAGATVATHLFNGMPPLHHREPGPVLAALESPAVTLELIVDGHHLHPGLVAAVCDGHPGRVALITDAMSAAGMPDGEYLLGADTVSVVGGAARAPSGSLAGSTLTMAAALRTAVGSGVGLAAASAMAATVPASALGLNDIGQIAVGYVADLVALTPQLRVTDHNSR